MNGLFDDANIARRNPCDLAGPVPSRLERTGRLSAARTGSLAHLGRCRRHACVLCPCRDIGVAFDRFRPLVDLYYAAGIEAGHAREDLKISIHAMGFVGETDEDARDAFYPGWERVIRDIGCERGFPPPSRAQFNALCGPDRAFLVGSPATVRDKMIAADATMGGISRITFQMSTAALETERMQRSITLLGEEVAPAVRAAL